jgi:type I restriction enzyme S subunit
MSKWKKVKLGEVCEQINGVSYKPSDVSENLLEHYIPVLRAHNIQDDGLNADKLVYVREEIVNPRQIIKTDDIIICASSGSKNLVGKAAQSYKSSRVTFWCIL